MMREKVVCCYKFALWLEFGKFVRNLLGLFFMKKKQNIIQFTNKSSFFFFLWLKIVKVNIWVKKIMYLSKIFMDSKGKKVS